jgi:hypothetical protein
MPAAASDLETGVHHWTRMVKLALGPPRPRHPRRRMTGETPSSDLSADRGAPLLRVRRA